MDRMVYLAMTGANQTMMAQAVNSNNLANISTSGFRADMHNFSERPVEGPGFDTRINVVTEGTGWSNRPGPVVTTGRNLDVAINGEGWIAVQAPNGDEAYTRAGDLQLTSLGMLTTGAGHPVLGNGGPIAVPPNSSITIGTGGEISIIALGDTAANLTNTGEQLKLVNPDPALLQKGQDGLMRYQDNQIAEPDETVRLINGSLEGSNVNAVGSMMNMIQLARHFELQVKVMETADQNSGAATRLMQLT